MTATELTFPCPACGAEVQTLGETEKQQSLCPSCGKALPRIKVSQLRGFVYILSNPKMQGLLKIGQTERTVEERAAEISAHEGVPVPFVVEAYFASSNPAADEALVHARLAHCRQPRREFFSIELQQALDTVHQVCGRPPRYCRPGLHYQIPAARAAQQANAEAAQRAQEARAREEAAAAQRAREEFRQLSVLGKIAAVGVGQENITPGAKIAAAVWLLCVIVSIAALLGLLG